MRVALKHLYHPTEINLFSVRNKNSLDVLFVVVSEQIYKRFLTDSLQ